jgi:hypothetical protein
MVYSFARHGIVDGDFWAESNGEGLLLFAKVAPHLDQLRREVNPTLFRSAEWLTEHSTEGRRILEYLGARVARALESR